LSSTSCIAVRELALRSAAPRGWVKPAPQPTNLKPEDLHKLQKASQPSMEEFIDTLAAS
jgi:hypothetical protein